MLREIEHTLFPVKEVSIPKPKFDGKKWIFGRGKTGYKLLIRQDTKEVISCMTNDYQKLDNKKLIKSALPILKENGAILDEVAIFGNARVTYKFRFPNVNVPLHKGDIVNPQVIIRNSYDGSTQAMIQAGAFRVVCSNGMVIGIVLKKKKNRHIIWNNGLGDMQDIMQETVSGIVNVFNEDFPVLYDTQLKDEDLAAIFNLFPTDINSIATDVIIKNKPQTYWDLLNVATEITTHHLNRSQETTHKIEQQIYPTFLNLAKKASA
ncbi:DUF932 domain-containing protein [Candidatus Neomarinimicrobiota bacterium]